MTATENPTAEPNDEALEAHREVGRMAGQYGIDMLIGVCGELVKRTALYAGAAGVLDIALIADNATAATYLESILRPGDKLIVKASRSGQLWQIAQPLTGQPVTGL
ncbi:UDP-N-acetylmuramoylalanyl-D-glutamate--2,6-diaminopimelate ligase [Streptomyces sp. NBC_01438]|uniref:UDP-N-acetylmuramoylalanyl-D-glutamate--2, 6-diaminopimelate ligase n=1 Tax=Streptomyces sp. NBC_01438 TaxID=2903866 RepID=UPI00324D6DFA